MEQLVSKIIGSAEYHVDAAGTRTRELRRGILALFIKSDLRDLAL